MQLIAMSGYIKPRADLNLGQIKMAVFEDGQAAAQTTSHHGCIKHMNIVLRINPPSLIWPTISLFLQCFSSEVI